MSITAALIDIAVLVLVHNASLYQQTSVQVCSTTASIIPFGATGLQLICLHYRKTNEGRDYFTVIPLFPRQI